MELLVRADSHDDAAVLLGAIDHRGTARLHSGSARTASTPPEMLSNSTSAPTG